MNKQISGIRGDADVALYIDVKKCVQEHRIEFYKSKNDVILTRGCRPHGDFTAQWTCIPPPCIAGALLLNSPAANNGHSSNYHGNKNKARPGYSKSMCMPTVQPLSLEPYRCLYNLSDPSGLAQAQAAMAAQAQQMEMQMGLMQQQQAMHQLECYLYLGYIGFIFTYDFYFRNAMDLIDLHLRRS